MKTILALVTFSSVLASGMSSFSALSHEVAEHSSVESSDEFSTEVALSSTSLCQPALTSNFDEDAARNAYYDSFSDDPKALFVCTSTGDWVKASLPSSLSMKNGSSVELKFSDGSVKFVPFAQIFTEEQLSASAEGRQVIAAGGNPSQQTSSSVQPPNKTQSPSQAQLPSPAKRTGKFNIELRYGDSSKFSEVDKQELEEAARLWETFITTKFDPVPAGNALRYRDPNADRRNYLTHTGGIPDGTDLVIFVGRNSNVSSGTAYSAPFFASDESLPRICSIGLAPKSRRDRIGVGLVVHEIGHCLGISDGRAFYDKHLVDTPGEVYQSFNGPTAKAVNNGNPIPLWQDLKTKKRDSGHFHYEQARVPGSNLIPSVSPNAGSFLPTIFDLAVLKDIGYDIPIMEQSTKPKSLDFVLRGTDGKDKISGHDGNDIIIGGRGDDSLYGMYTGNGENNSVDRNNTFVFEKDSGKDTIYGFRVGEDTIQVSPAYGLSAAELKERVVDTKRESGFSQGGPFVFLPVYTIKLDDKNSIKILSEQPLTLDSFRVEEYR